MENRLLEGFLRFRQEDFESHQKLFQELGRSQKPHNLFIGCADSRVVPNLITQTTPGELFTVRNVANIVPPYRVSTEYAATTSAIEYAVQALKVESIVVCGHSNCGGCSALHLPPQDLEKLPNVRKWLEILEPVKIEVDKLAPPGSPEGSPEEREWLTEQVNIVHQLRNLLTYPYIRSKLGTGELKIFGWYYMIETGEIFNYNPDTKTFDPVS
ncbi:MAG: carbonic anhydrase [Desulfuromonas sp.]|nr:MAG: carbonic anhydrase [Desulfuromonas sp.]